MHRPRPPGAEFDVQSILYAFKEPVPFGVQARQEKAWRESLGARSRVGRRQKLLDYFTSTISGSGQLRSK